MFTRFGLRVPVHWGSQAVWASSGVHSCCGQGQTTAGLCPCCCRVTCPGSSGEPAPDCSGHLSSSTAHQLQGSPAAGPGSGPG